MDGKVVIGTELDTKGFDKEIALLEDKLNDIKASLQMADSDKTLFSSREVKEMEAEAQKLGRRLDALKQKQAKIGSAGFADMKRSIESAGNSITKVIKKVTRWGLAIFGVRSAYMAVRSAINILSEGDSQLKANIDYIKWALANTLKPIIEWIINAVYTILRLIGQIIQLITGYNIFKNSGIKDYEKSLKSSNKSAKQLSKTLAGFDEMNVLQDNKTKDTSGGGTPSFDLSKTLPEGKTPEWLQWIVDHKDEVIAGLAGIAGGLIALKLGLSPLQSLGIGIALAGIVYTIEKIIDYIKDPSFENFIGILKGIALTVAGVALAFGAWPVAIGAALTLGLLTLMEHWDQVKEWLGNLVNWIDTDFRAKLVELFGPIGDIIADTFKTAIEIVTGVFDTLFGAIKDIYDGIIKITQGDLWGGLQQIFGGLLDILLLPFRTFVTIVQEVFSLLVKWITDFVIKPIGDFFAGVWNGIKDGAKNAWNGIKNIFSSVASFFGNIFGKAWEAVKKVFSTGGKIFSGIKEGILNSFKKIVNVIIDGLNKVVKIPFDGINAALNGLRGVDLWGWRPFDWVPQIKVPQIPRLAKGGIINYPGRGVAIGGEAGKEGVLPLTDSQQMELLGATIGRYITVELTNITQLDGRQIARKVEQINQNNDFVLNR